jgi:hypothetical protein
MNKPNSIDHLPSYVRARVQDNLDWGADVWRIDYTTPMPSGEPFWVIRTIRKDGGCSVEKIYKRDENKEHKTRG